MDEVVWEIYIWNYDEVSQIFTYSQLHKLINLCIIITLYLVTNIIIRLFTFVY
jgi:hypothetical protein